jgi:acetyl/propionyl-CoA carboxylase alpha subunit
MFKKIIVANRGEIALRILRTLREMNLRSVAVYSEADRQSPHLELARAVAGRRELPLRRSRARRRARSGL